MKVSNDYSKDRHIETYDLQLYGHHSEVENLNGRPEHVVGLEGRHINVAKFARDRSSPTALSYGHEGEEAAQACVCQ